MVKPWIEQGSLPFQGSAKTNSAIWPNGETGIWTLGGYTPLPMIQEDAIGHSAISPLIGRGRRNRTSLIGLWDRWVTTTLSRYQLLTKKYRPNGIWTRVFWSKFRDPGPLEDRAIWRRDSDSNWDRRFWRPPCCQLHYPHMVATVRIALTPPKLSAWCSTIELRCIAKKKALGGNRTHA